MNTGTFEKDTFDALVKQTIEEIKTKYGFTKKDKWLSGDEIMTALRIENETVLQQLRDEGKIRFIQPEPAIILYDADSLDSARKNTPKTNSDGDSR